MSILEINKECLNCWFARVCIGWSLSHYGIIVMNVLTRIEKIELFVSFPSQWWIQGKGPGSVDPHFDQTCVNFY